MNNFLSTDNSYIYSLLYFFMFDSQMYTFIPKYSETNSYHLENIFFFSYGIDSTYLKRVISERNFIFTK